ncbi:MAG: thioredoxin-disulfide reductase [Chthoniobacterales bacterium]|nr:thioredoxin-disulfide reductase [Chthoniobacterales bacterium]
MENVIIIGTGCAGLTAAIYTARANLSPLVLEGNLPGGQLTTTTEVENFPGFPEGINGPELIQRMHQQAERFGARFDFGTVEDFEQIPSPTQPIQRMKVDGKWLESRALIIASGASPRWLGLENEKALIGHGLTSCATCDGAFYRNMPVCVVGGGDSACEEALFLTRFASIVYLIHRRDVLRASKIMANRLLSNPKIYPIWNSIVIRYLPDEKGKMRGVVLRNVKTNEETELEVKCVFMAIGHEPNTAPFRGKVECDAEGYIVLKEGMRTSLPGVFAAGDVADRHYRQAITAAGMGCAAAIEAERWLAEFSH